MADSADPPYELIIDARVTKFVSALPPKQRGQVSRKIQQLEQNPRPHDHIKLKGKKGFRLTAGEYRVLYDIDDEHRIVEVYKVIPRNDGYRSV